MASQITHIPYGKKVKDKFLSHIEINDRDFYIGTVFPDIRYLGKVGREQTHISDPTIEGLLSAPTDFQKGLYVHSLIDHERERVVEKLGLYDLVPKNKLTIYALKFLEDEYSYTLVDNWEIYRNYLQTILEEEKQIVTEDVAIKWHQLLSDYFHQPTWDSVLSFSKDFQGITPELLMQIKMEIENLRHNPKVINIIQSTYKELFS